MSVVRPNSSPASSVPSRSNSGTITRGMTVVDDVRAGGRGPAPANARVLLDADEQAVIDGIVDAIIALDAS